MKYIKYIGASLAALCLGEAVHTPFRLTTSPAALNIRGGDVQSKVTDSGTAIRLPVHVGTNIIGKVLNVAWLLQGTALSLAPKPQADLDGFGGDEATLLWVEHLGAVILSTAVASFCVQFRILSVHRSIGWCAFVWLVHHVKWLLNQTYQKNGVGYDTIAFSVVPNLFVLYAGFASPEWADSCFYAVNGVYAVTALLGIFFPRWALGSYA